MIVILIYQQVYFSNFYLLNLTFPIFHRNENFQRSHSHADEQRMNMGYQFKNIWKISFMLNQLRLSINLVPPDTLFSFSGYAVLIFVSLKLSVNLLGSFRESLLESIFSIFGVLWSCGTTVGGLDLNGLMADVETI